MLETAVIPFLRICKSTTISNDHIISILSLDPLRGLVFDARDSGLRMPLDNMSWRKKPLEMALVMFVANWQECFSSPNYRMSIQP